MALAVAVTAPVTRWRFWLSVAAGLVLLLWLLSNILLPFVVGAVLAATVFLAGHLLEGNVLSFNLVGDRVGLHPAWIMFALLAGGSLFGFVGVLVRHLLSRYHASSFYRGSVSG